jgi:hypothetical protein
MTIENLRPPYCSISTGTILLTVRKKCRFASGGKIITARMAPVAKGSHFVVSRRPQLLSIKETRNIEHVMTT